MVLSLPVLLSLAVGPLTTSSPVATCDIVRQPAAATGESIAMVEIPAGGQVKYELHEASGRMEVDRFLAMPVAYPVNYGILPCTRAGDGDPLDVLVLTRLAVDPGALIRVRPVGVLRMRDDGEEDDKLIMVPVSAVDPDYDGVEDLDDLPAAQLERIRAFFEVYKRLPEPGGSVELGPWEGPDAARAIIRMGTPAG